MDEWTELSRTRIAAGDNEIEVVISRAPEGVVVTLAGVDCDLEGEMPGEYWVAPSGTIAARYGGER